MTSLKRLLTSITAGALLVLSATAQAHTTTTTTLAEIGGAIATVSLLGSGLQIEVILDASGSLSQVNLDPSTGATVDEAGPHEVEFQFTDTGTEVAVESGDELEIEVETAALAELLGPGSWSADLFGTGMVTVSYLIGETGGTPTITLGGVVVPAGVELTVRDDSGDDDETEVKIDFTLAGFRKTLRIEVENEGDQAELEISLKGEDGSLASFDEIDEADEEDDAPDHDEVDEEDDDSDHSDNDDDTGDDDSGDDEADD